MVMSRRLSLLVSFLLPMKSEFLMTLGAEAFPSWCSQLTHLFSSCYEACDKVAWLGSDSLGAVHVPKLAE